MKTKNVLCPFYQPFNSENIGFVKLAEAVKLHSKYRLTLAGRKILTPLMATTLVFLFMLFDYFLDPTLVKNSEYFMVMVITWVLILLVSDEFKKMIAILIIPIGIGYFIKDSIYGGYLGFAVGLGIYFFLAYKDVFFFNLTVNQVEIETRKTISGEDFLSPHGKYRKWEKIKESLSIGRRQLHQLVLLSFPFLHIYLLYKIFSSFDISKPTIELQYFDFSTDSLVVAIPLIFLYGNISILGFRSIHKYLQKDYFQAISEKIAIKKAYPKQFLEDEKRYEEKLKTQQLSGQDYTVNPTDRIMPLEIIPMNNFYAILTFFFFDGILTIATVLGIDFIPGIGLNEMGTLSSIIKIPFYTLFVYHCFKGFHTWAFHKEIFFDLRKLLKEAQGEQIIKNKNYINASDNKYLQHLGKLYP